MRTGSLMVLADARFKLPEGVKELSSKQLEHVANECEAYEWFPASAEGGSRASPAALPAVSVLQGIPWSCREKVFPPPSKTGCFPPSGMAAGI